MKADRGRDTPGFVRTRFRVVSVATGNEPKGGYPELPSLEIDQGQTMGSKNKVDNITLIARSIGYKIRVSDN
jgi:hypothetical protein